ncbi:hypothetical protein FBY05_101578 [Pseudomonas sp. SJZ083]|nr:hypothetical protein FBY05_101578 [Pseudomonas sp. SJZ083]TWC53947.1 hypothetical protein FBY01_101138 [Pseudomonas sp. SJZ077]
MFKLLCTAIAVCAVTACTSVPPAPTRLASQNPDIVVSTAQNGWPTLQEMRFRDTNKASLEQIQFCMVQQITNDSIAPVTDASKQRVVMPGTGSYYITVMGTSLRSLTKFTVVANRKDYGVEYVFRNILVNSGYGFNELNASEEATMHVEALHSSLKLVAQRITNCLAD